jgi:hypothetical protein
MPAPAFIAGICGIIGGNWHIIGGNISDRCQAVAVRDLLE